MAQLSNKNKRILIDKHYDLGFVARTQPQGNIKIHSGYIEEGNGYAAFLTIYKYPADNLPAFWLSRLVNQEHVIALLSVRTQNVDKVKPKLDQSITELRSRVENQNSKPTQALGATMDATSLINTYRNLKNNSETLKRITLRLLVYDSTLPKLMTRIRGIKDGFMAFKMTRFIDEQEYALHSIYLPMSLQQNMPNHRKGTIVQSYDLGGSYMFNYVNLQDPGGEYFGFTQTRGAFVFNPYNMTGDRTRVFSLVAGESGAGKSTFLKMLNDDAFIRGHYIRNFDVTGEYRRAIKAQQGVIINTSDFNNRVNMFEIFPTVAKPDGSVDEVASFDNNVDKILTISHIMNPDLSHTELTLLKSYINGFYIWQQMWVPEAQQHLDEVKVIGLPHEQYPTLTLFINYLHDKLADIEADQHHRDQHQLDATRNLYLDFKNMDNNYGRLFNGHTNVKNFSKEKVVDFDMQSAADMSAGMNANLFQAQFFNYLSMVSAQMILNGRHYRQLEADGKLVDDKLGFNINYYYINIDEAEDYFNPKYPDVVQMIASMMEQMRKNYCAITLSFPTLKDVLISNTSHSDNYAAYQDAVSRIFNLIQYFHFFELQGGDLDALRKFFSKNRAVSLEQLSTLPNLHKYQVLTIIVGERSYQWTTELSPDSNQEERYKS